MTRRRLALLIAVPVLALLAGGCRTERVVTSDGRPLPPKPRSLRTAPSEAPAQYMLLRCETTQDSNGNGYPDVIPVVTSLMHEPQFATLEARGTFVFTLWRRGEALAADAAPLRTWRIADDAVRAGRMEDRSGVFYRFRLNMLEGGSDVLPATSGDLRGRYEPASGPAVDTSDEPRSVQIGRGIRTS